MKKQKDKYRIVELHNKFFVEKLTRILFWDVYIAISDEKLSIEQKNFMLIDGKSTNKFFDSIVDARKYIDSCEIKYYKY